MSQTPSSTANPLTVVLVHGAFADASSRTGVIERLQVGREITQVALVVEHRLKVLVAEVTAANGA